MTKLTFFRLSLNQLILFKDSTAKKKRDDFMIKFLMF